MAPKTDTRRAFVQTQPDLLNPRTPAGSSCAKCNLPLPTLRICKHGRPTGLCSASACTSSTSTTTYTTSTTTITAGGGGGGGFGGGIGRSTTHRSCMQPQPCEEWPVCPAPHDMLRPAVGRPAVDRTMLSRLVVAEFYNLEKTRGRRATYFKSYSREAFLRRMAVADEVDEVGELWRLARELRDVAEGRKRRDDIAYLDESDSDGDEAPSGTRTPDEDDDETWVDLRDEAYPSAKAA